MDFTIADVLAWARTKPADEHYEYCDAKNCAVAQFGNATGREHLTCIVDLGEAERNGVLPVGLWEALADDELTFGGLVARLEKLCPDQIATPSEWTRLDAYLTDIEMVRA